MPCRAAFDRLTEYASLLLQHGDRDIYSTPREEIAIQLEAGEAAELKAVMGNLPEELKTYGSIAEQSFAEQPATGQQAPADPEVDMFGEPEPQPQAATAVSDAAVDPEHTVSVPANQQADDASCSVDGPEGPQTHSNFTFDESTGTWFNADLGYYYDASHGLYGDAASGHWYSYRDGAYQLVY